MEILFQNVQDLVVHLICLKRIILCLYFYEYCTVSLPPNCKKLWQDSDLARVAYEFL